MKWPRLGIRVKLSITVLCACLLIAVGLSIPLEKKARSVVEEHEMANLQDDGERRCWQLIDAVNQVRRKTYRFGYQEDGGDQFDAFCAQLNREAAAQKSNAQRAQLTGWDEYIMAVYSYDADKNVTERYVAPGVKALPAGSVRLPEHLAAARINKTYAKISPILPVRVPAGFVPGMEPRKGEAAAHEIIVPCIWAAANYKRKSARFDKSLGGDETAQGGIAICVCLYRGGSARHWQFLTDDRQYLAHPEVGADGQPVALYRRRMENGNKEEPVDLVADSRDPTQWESGGVVPAGAAGGSSKGTGTTVLLSQTERRRGPSETAELAERFVFLEGQLPAESAVALDGQTDHQEWLAETVAEAERNGYETSIERDGLVRLRARSEAATGDAKGAVKGPKKAIEKALRDRLGNDYRNIAWSSAPVVLKTADYQRVRFSLVSKPVVTGEEREDQEGEIGPWYYLTSGVFHEELASGIAAELGKARKWGSLIAVLAALLALLAATYFVRPLVAITETARRVASESSEPSDGKLIERVESVVREVELHTQRKDEVGRIAQGLKKLLDRVLEGHQQLLEERSRLDRVVEEQTHDLKEQAEKLVKADKVKNNFISAMSHDLRSPLASIQGRIHLLMQTELTPKQRSGLEKVNLASLHLKNVIESILDFRRLEEGAIVLRPVKFEAAQFFQGLKDSILPLAQARNNQLEFEGTDAVGEMFTDETALRRALENLLNNACKFTAEGVVKLTVARRERKGRTWLKMAVSDTGRGIDPAVRPHLFTPFSKLADEQLNPGGAGLGLANSRQYIQMMGGTLELGPETGVGTTFIIRIPADVRADEKEAAAGGVSQDKHFSTEHEIPLLPPEKRQLVLVVDDDPSVATSLEEFLIPQGYRVVSALTGAGGVELAKSHHPDVILLDIVLANGQNGLDVLSQLKNDPEVKDIPVMMLSFLEKTKLSEQKGAADYIPKPIPWKDLLASLRRTTGSASTQSAPILVVDDDEKLREVFKEVLTNNGFAVVEAANGAEALQRLREVKPSIILLDLRMPVVDGFAFLAEIHQHAEWTEIPVLVVTAAALTPEEERKIAGAVAGIKNKTEEIHNAIVPAVLSTLNESGLKSKTKELHG